MHAQSSTLQEKVEALADLIDADSLAHYKAWQSKNYPDSTYDYTRDCTVRVTYGKKYIRIDRGHSYCGKYMIDIETEVIYGIKAYGVIHRGHQYGNLDSIHEWYWGDYTATRKTPVLIKHLANLGVEVA